MRGSKLHSITPEEVAALARAADEPASPRQGPGLEAKNGKVELHPELQERVQRSMDTVAKLDEPFAVYWIKASDDDPKLNRDLAKLCRQEDVVCHNRDGEFVAILTATDANGVKGFERRIDEKLGERLSGKAQRGFELHEAKA